MDFLYRSTPPGYKGKAPPAQARTGFLSGLTCYLFGGGAPPAYRTKNQTNDATAPVVTRCWWALSGAPQYKVAPAVTSPEHSPTGEELMGEDGSCEPEPDVVPREIHVYPG